MAHLIMESDDDVRRNKIGLINPLPEIFDDELSRTVSTSRSKATNVQSSRRKYVPKPKLESESSEKNKKSPSSPSHTAVEKKKSHSKTSTPSHSKTRESKDDKSRSRKRDDKAPSNHASEDEQSDEEDSERRKKDKKKDKKTKKSKKEKKHKKHSKKKESPSPKKKREPSPSSTEDDSMSVVSDDDNDTASQTTATTGGQSDVGSVRDEDDDQHPEDVQHPADEEYKAPMSVSKTASSQVSNDPVYDKSAQLGMDPKKMRPDATFPEILPKTEEQKAEFKIQWQKDQEAKKLEKENKKNQTAAPTSQPSPKSVSPSKKISSSPAKFPPSQFAKEESESLKKDKDFVKQTHDLKRKIKELEKQNKKLTKISKSHKLKSSSSNQSDINDQPPSLPSELNENKHLEETKFDEQKLKQQYHQYLMSMKKKDFVLLDDFKLDKHNLFQYQIEVSRVKKESERREYVHRYFQKFSLFNSVVEKILGAIDSENEVYSNWSEKIYSKQEDYEKCLRKIYNMSQNSFKINPRLEFFSIFMEQALEHFSPFIIDKCLSVVGGDKRKTQTFGKKKEEEKKKLDSVETLEKKVDNLTQIIVKQENLLKKLSSLHTTSTNGTSTPSVSNSPKTTNSPAKVTVPVKTNVAQPTVVKTPTVVVTPPTVASDPMLVSPKKSSDTSKIPINADTGKPDISKLYNTLSSPSKKVDTPHSDIGPNTSITVFCKFESTNWPNKSQNFEESAVTYLHWSQNDLLVAITNIMKKRGLFSNDAEIIITRSLIAQGGIDDKWNLKDYNWDANITKRVSDLKLLSASGILMNITVNYPLDNDEEELVTVRIGDTSDDEPSSFGTQATNSTLVLNDNISIINDKSPPNQDFTSQDEQKEPPKKNFNIFEAEGFEALTSLEPEHIKNTSDLDKGFKAVMNLANIAPPITYKKLTDEELEAKEIQKPTNETESNFVNAFKDNGDDSAEDEPDLDKDIFDLY